MIPKNSSTPLKLCSTSPTSSSGKKLLPNAWKTLLKQESPSTNFSKLSPQFSKNSESKPSSITSTYSWKMSKKPAWLTMNSPRPLKAEWKSKSLKSWVTCCMKVWVGTLAIKFLKNKFPPCAMKIKCSARHSTPWTIKTFSTISLCLTICQSSWLIDW